MKSRSGLNFSPPVPRLLATLGTLFADELESIDLFAKVIAG